MESKYDVRSDILFVTDKVFRKFMARIPNTKPNKHPQIIENLVKDVLRENFTDYNPVDRAEIYNYVIGLKTIFAPDRYVPRSIDCVNLVDILSLGCPITTNPDGIVILDRGQVHAIGFLCEFDRGKRDKIISLKKSLLQKLISDTISIYNKQPGKVFLIDPISANLETMPYKQSLSIPKIPKTENTKAINFGSVIFIDKEGQFYKKFNTLQNQMSKYSHDKVPVYNYKLYKDSTFSSNDISWVDDIALFMPNLTSRANQNLKSILRRILENKTLTLANLKADIDEDIRNNSIMNTSVKTSIFESVGIFDGVRKLIFDQHEKTPVGKDKLLQSGITILDLSKLPEEEKIFATLATMLILHHSIEPEDDHRAHLVIDESSFFFPKSPSTYDKDFYERVTKFAAKITREGRKRHYGITFSNQNPSDMVKELIDPCLTKINFAHGDKRWTKNLFPGTTSPKNPGEIIFTTENIHSLHSIIETPNITDTHGRQNIARTEKKSDQIVGYLHPEGEAGGHAKAGGKIIYPGYSQGNNTNLIFVGDLLKSVFEDDDSNQKILTYFRIDSIQNVSKRYTGGLVRGKITMALEPLKQIVINNDSSLTTARRFEHGEYLFNLQLQIPNANDYNLAYDLPNSGIMLGVHQGTLLPIYLPFDRDGKREINADWLFDKSMYIVGYQGQGKTNLLVYLFYQFVHPNPSDVAEFLLDNLSN